jgi:hypothetical protein
VNNNFYYEQGSNNVLHLSELFKQVFNAYLICQFAVPTAGIPIYTYDLLDQYGMPLSDIPEGLGFVSSDGNLFIYPEYSKTQTFTI